MLATSGLATFFVLTAMLVLRFIEPPTVAIRAVQSFGEQRRLAITALFLFSLASQLYFFLRRWKQANLNGKGFIACFVK